MDVDREDGESSSLNLVNFAHNVPPPGFRLFVSAFSQTRNLDW